ncbi:uncharacterized protein [Vulpes vulpes]|uniref:Uncharacterized protein isoform X1 n=1 Tax=Vulpes vulpes TaxID=9627 RepID=A0ABM5B6W5_VULVU
MGFPPPESAMAFRPRRRPSGGAFAKARFLGSKKAASSPGGLEPPTSRLTAERANRLRHRDLRTVPAHVPLESELSLGARGSHPPSVGVDGSPATLTPAASGTVPPSCPSLTHLGRRWRSAHSPPRRSELGSCGGGGGGGQQGQTPRAARSSGGRGAWGEVARAAGDPEDPVPRLRPDGGREMEAGGSSPRVGIEGKGRSIPSPGEVGLQETAAAALRFLRKERGAVPGTTLRPESPQRRPSPWPEGWRAVIV